MGEDTDAEIREIKLKIENLLVAAHYRHVPQNVTITYLKELQLLRARLHALGGDKED
jgi:hypothetical protein